MAVIPLVVNRFYELDGQFLNTIGITILSNIFLFTFTPNLTGFCLPVLT